MNGSKFNYKFGQKNNWRRTIWNCVFEQTPAKSAKIIYLSGAENCDWTVLHRHGVQKLNCISVEKHSDTINKLRDDGVLTVSGKLHEVLYSWPSCFKIDVVHCDLCSGITLDALKTFRALYINPAFRYSVVVANLMRGRDSLGKQYIEKISESSGMKIGCEFLKHRANLLLLILNNAFRLDFQKQINTVLGTGHASENYYMENIGPLRTYSYRSSSGQIFDSAVFNNVSMIDLLSKHFNRQFDEESLKRIPLIPVKRRIAAILAIRTQRLNKISKLN